LRGENNRVNAATGRAKKQRDKGHGANWLQRERKVVYASVEGRKRLIGTDKGRGTSGSNISRKRRVWGKGPSERGTRTLEREGVREDAYPL